MKQDKPEGAKIGWHLKETSYPYESKWFSVRKDELEVDGKPLSFGYIDQPEAVSIVPLTAEGQIVLIRQYRYIVDEWGYEVPAGGTHDTGDASLEDVARHELEQEIGAECDKLIEVGRFNVANGFSNQRLTIFLAVGVRLSKDPEPERTEVIELHPVPVGKAIEMARRGDVADGPSALSILRCEPLLRERGYLQ